MAGPDLGLYELKSTSHSTSAIASLRIDALQRSSLVRSGSDYRGNVPALGVPPLTVPNLSAADRLPLPHAPVALVDGSGRVESQGERAHTGNGANRRITILIAAHNEEQSIGSTLDSCFDQTRPADLVVVAADNCTDRTEEIARDRGAYVFATVENTHRKSGALNQAWSMTRLNTELYICIDADTVLPPNALKDWEREFARRGGQKLAGCSAKFTMMTPGQMRALAVSGELPAAPLDLPPMTARERFWVRLQRAEFSKWTDTALARKNRWTSVLAGTACAIRASALEDVVNARKERQEAPLPWTYASEVEDFELTYRLRELGYFCRVSADVRAYTGAMLTIKTLWAQRLKWQVGTVRDLRSIGFNRLTAIDWWQQCLGLISAFVRVSWVALLLIGAVAFHHVRLLHFWWIFPVAFIIFDLREAYRIPHRTRADLVTAALLLPQELFACIRAAWFTWSWIEVLLGNKRDRWALQIAAEGGNR